ncbi:EH signature domain-containing protein [uncultured Pseudoalteromonas sp.]|uniref:EH signature domain-containing protein n=1 Tax=uncultured Pseudoalteromonas sp. TaxID=114053 RepID=UPI002591A61F|nr:EH signature domain-containing protein [uncultured Pseudoalteromonas sp.]
MNLRYIKKLKFALPDHLFRAHEAKLNSLTNENRRLAKHPGVSNEKFKAAWSKLYNTVINGGDLTEVIENKTDIRALAILLDSKIKDKVQLSAAAIETIKKVTQDKPNHLLIESMYQFFLSKFNQLENVEKIANWLVEGRKLRGVAKDDDEQLLSVDGPKWLASLAIKQQKDLDNLLHDLHLNRYAKGQFMQIAQRIYYVEQLKNIPLNRPHDLLLEVQKKAVFESKYSDNELLGHQILSILIARAPSENIHESWLNVIMAIAGDPRIPISHPRYIRWWHLIDSQYIHKVRGWLSRLDLKLFLEALEDFSSSSTDPEMKRMYPSRKRFLEGLYEKKLIQNTRLFMSRSMTAYLKRNYQSAHLPDFSQVTDNDKSLIYVDLGGAQLVEGSHSCYLWIYKRLHESAVIFDYTKSRFTYNELTSGLNRKMQKHECGAVCNITHNPNVGWQNKAVSSLQGLNVPLKAVDVLTNKDYSLYLRKYGNH